MLSRPICQGSTNRNHGNGDYSALLTFLHTCSDLKVPMLLPGVQQHISLDKWGERGEIGKDAAS